MRNIVIGAAILVAAFLFRVKLVAVAPELFYYAVLVAGAALVIYGLMGHFRSRKGGEEAAEESGRSLAHEVLLKSLARMSYADTHIADIEVETIQRIYQETTGEEISRGDVRVAARADIYEEESFEKYLAGVQGSLSDDDKKMIMTALAAVIRADGSVSPFEVDFFNQVCEALKVPAACLSDLESDAAEPETVAAPEIPEEMLGEKPTAPPADPEPDASEEEPDTLNVEDEPEPADAAAEEAEAEAEEAEKEEEEAEKAEPAAAEEAAAEEAEGEAEKAEGEVEKAEPAAAEEAADAAAEEAEGEAEEEEAKPKT
ncbi:MAG: TerB family tellurite resistance protein [Proteobacteria bacterium]|nr:TerB family tellurite resistance protein [Pseudomonadota bacterium]